MHSILLSGTWQSLNIRIKPKFNVFEILKVFERKGRGCFFETLNFQTGHMLFMYYGSMAILIWKCGTQLLTEVQYKPINEESEKAKKAKARTNKKYEKIIMI